jgi:hypothetical protein
MALYQTLTGKRGRNDNRGEMLTVTVDFKMRALEPGGNIVFDQIRGG